MQQTVGTEPVVLGAGETLGDDGGEVVGLSRPFVQNLGAGDLYLDFTPTVAAGTGYRLQTGESIEFNNALRMPLYAVASASTDVRFIDAG